MANPSDHRYTVKNITDEARTFLEEASKYSPETWAELPETTVNPEALAQLAIAKIDQADQAAIALRDGKPLEEALSDAELFRKGFELTKSTDLLKAALLTLVPSSTGSRDDEDLGGMRDRNSVRKQAFDIIAKFSAKRVAQAQKKRQ